MAFVSKVQIANMALANIGARDSIENLTESSVEAKTANLWYDPSRIATLEMHNWTFARKRTNLALIDDTPIDWGYRYQYPADCIRARVIIPVTGSQTVFNTQFPDQFNLQSPDSYPFTIEMTDDGQLKTILTDIPDAVLQYTYDAQNTGLFTQLFIKTFAYMMASNMAFKLTGKQQLTQLMFQQAQQMLLIATTQDANEGIEKAPRDAPWVRGR